MKLQELLRNNDWLSVELTLKNLYPDQGKNVDTYGKIFQKLREMAPTNSNMTISLEQCFEDETNEESYVHVSGLEPNPDNSNVTDSYGIEFVPWSEWLGMSIHPDSLKAFNELEIIVHCVYEMTFYGFDEETIQGAISEMGKSIEETKNRSEEEKRANTKSIDDWLKELDNE